MGWKCYMSKLEKSCLKTYLGNKAWEYDVLTHDVMMMREYTWLRTFHGSAPIRSSLLIKATLGTWYLFICLSTVIDWLCTPPTLQRTRIAPSRTRKALSTSIVKSTWPGVSIIFICKEHFANHNQNQALKNRNRISHYQSLI